MKINVLQHAVSEGPGEIGAWAGRRGNFVREHHLYRGDALPATDSFDLLVVMGGEMNIYQYRDYPWLKPERQLIEAALNGGKRVIGVCLGGQLIADALGSRVTQNPDWEMGWFPIAFSDEGRAVYPELPGSASVLHWHSDTFGLPAGATRLASSPACPEQGYVIPGKCLGLQFHLEVDPPLVKQFVASQGYWPEGPWVQKPEEIMAQAPAHCEANKRFLCGMLDRFCADMA
ncbi:MAG TPA: type 1 glutamine amidotransferase [Candidatus Methylacidiphilales bacterium]|nr:type 1 glutamine amidotransferase [Candidatus Methylacidiphilales bacterium]